MKKLYLKAKNPVLQKIKFPAFLYPLPLSPAPLPLRSPALRIVLQKIKFPACYSAKLRFPRFYKASLLPLPPPGSIARGEKPYFVRFF